MKEGCVEFLADVSFHYAGALVYRRIEMHAWQLMVTIVELEEAEDA